MGGVVGDKIASTAWPEVLNGIWSLCVGGHLKRHLLITYAAFNFFVSKLVTKQHDR